MLDGFQYSGSRYPPPPLRTHAFPRSHTPAMQVETLRVRSASLYAELAEASAQRKREARQARKGAQVANQEKVVGRVEGFVFVNSYGDDHRVLCLLCTVLIYTASLHILR